MSEANLRDRWSGDIRFRCPETLPHVIDHAASRRMKSRSGYIRDAVLEQLRADGIDLAQFQPAGAA